MTTRHFTTPSSALITVDAALDESSIQAARAAGIGADLLGSADGANAYSRLSCQIRVTAALHGVHRSVVPR